MFSVTSGPLSREILAACDRMNSGGCPRKEGEVSDCHEHLRTNCFPVRNRLFLQPAALWREPSARSADLWSRCRQEARARPRCPRTPRRECERGSSAREIVPWLGKGSATRSPRHPKRRNKPNLAELQWNQAPTPDRPATELRAVCKLLVGGSANRSLTVAAPAGGSRLFGSRAREQAVSSKILFGFLK